MTRRRRLSLFGLPVALVALGVAGWLLLPRTAITRENAAKIQEGMTLAEVEAILGGPARDDTTGPTTGNAPWGTAQIIGHIPRWVSTKDWDSDSVSIVVRFDSDQRVTDYLAYHTRRTDVGVLAMFRRWVRL